MEWHAVLDSGPYPNQGSTMLGKRPPWMTRAVIGGLICLAIVVIYTIGFIWLYGKLAPLAPDWLSRRGGRGLSIVENVGVWGYPAGIFLMALFVAPVVFQRLRVPQEAFESGFGVDDYPVKRRISRAQREQDELQKKYGRPD